MKTVIIGGTFNPVHIGHLFLAEEVRLQTSCERVLLVPSFLPAHKRIDSGVTAEDRLEMLRLAVEPLEGIQVEDCEIRRGGISYSIDTVRTVYRHLQPQDRLGLVIGDDLFETFPTWKDHTALLDLCDLFVAHRLYEKELSFSLPHNYLKNKILPLSSSEIRTRIADRAAFRHLVPEPVYAYIQSRGLYRRPE